MRERFSRRVEGSRFVDGPYRSGGGEHNGAFILRHPNTYRKFMVIISDGGGWDHVSVSTRNRCPTWDEMCWVKDLFFDVTEYAIQIHPRAEDYVNDHPHCLHLWKPQDEHLELPPPIFVGLGRKS